MPHCLLNIDLGELADESDELYQLADIANIACGGHAGDDASMAHALALCAASHSQAGAHPSYADPQNFGRIRQDISLPQLRSQVAEQCAKLAAHAARLALRLHYMKPHGALYHAANGDALVATAVIGGARDSLGDDFCVIGPPHGELEAAAQVMGLRYMREGFADRGRRADGCLLPRSEPGAVIDDPQRAQVQTVELAKSGQFDTLCVHGDTPNAIAVARAVREILDELAASRHEPDQAASIRRCGQTRR